MSQLAFEWQQHASYATEDFIISGSNEEAVRFLDAFPGDNIKTMLLCAPKACGKTHLAHIWANKNNAVFIDSSLLGALPSEKLWGEMHCAVLENIETITDETALFHLLRYGETQGKCLLLTSKVTARSLPFTLPDLCSRLLALPAAIITSPDDGLLQVFTIKCLSDRQLRVSEDAVQYMLSRMERSFANIYDTIARIEKASLQSKRQVTIPLIKEVMGG